MLLHFSEFHSFTHGFRERINREIVEEVKTHGINTIHAFTRHPQGNASDERSHRTIIEALQIYINGYKEHWAYFVPAVQYAYDTTPHNRDATGITPYNLMFGLPPPPPHGHVDPPCNLSENERELFGI